MLKLSESVEAAEESYSKTWGPGVRPSFPVAAELAEKSQECPEHGN